MRADGYGRSADRAEMLMLEHGIKPDDEVLIGFDIHAELAPFSQIGESAQ